MGDIMIDKINLKSHLYRKSTFYKIGDSSVPKELFEVVASAPDLEGFPYPLPSCKKDYVCFCESNGVFWYGARTGLTRYDKNAEYDFDHVMYFSADRDLLDNNVRALLPDGMGVWVLTNKGVAHIEMLEKTPEEVCEILLAETLKYVDRQGMVSQRYLAEPRNLDSALPYGSSDNDGGFTSCFSISEIFKYAVMKREKGINAPETIEAKKVAIRALDACMFLMYVHGRGDGFVARTYIFDGEPLPDDGVFFKRNGDTAVCLSNSESEKRGCVGATVDCSAPIPDRYKYLYEEKGKTLDDIIYKADTSSDEITFQLLNCLFAHKYLACDDKELDDIIKESVKGIVSHILDNGHILKDFTGKPTTWARWDEPYFDKAADGWVDAALNSAELLFYLKAVMEITGETGKWLEAYNYLVYERGYADLTEKHFDRMYQESLENDIHYAANIMYGDHFLAVASFFGLCWLEKDENLLKKYRYGFKSWRTTLEPEHNPGYDFLYLIACPDETLDTERIKEWFYRSNLSRLASGVSLVGRHDIPVKYLKGDYKQSSVLLPPDELFISKYDRDALEYKNVDSGGEMCVESSYVYTFAYWIGKYFGFIG